MKKFVFAICVFTAVYLGLHVVQFNMNEPYRNRLSNEAYLKGQTTVTYYKIL